MVRFVKYTLVVSLLKSSLGSEWLSTSLVGTFRTFKLVNLNRLLAKPFIYRGRVFFFSPLIQTSRKFGFNQTYHTLLCIFMWSVSKGTDNSTVHPLTFFLMLLFLFGRLRNLYLILYSSAFNPLTGEMKRVASNPDLVINRPHSPLPSSPISRRASPGNLGTSRDVHIANRPCVFRKISSPLASPSSPVMSTRRRRTLSESNKPELLSPVIPKRIMAKTVSSPVQTRKPLMSQATPCPESNVSPPISPVSSPWEPSFVPPKSRPATPYISSASPPLHAPENKDRLPHIAQSHNPRLVRPLSPIRMPLDSNRGLFNISPVLGARESDSNGEECESCCDLQEKVNNFLQSMSLEENWRKMLLRRK